MTIYEFFKHTLVTKNENEIFSRIGCRNMTRAVVIVVVIVVML